MPYVANYQDVDTPETGGRYTNVNRFPEPAQEYHPAVLGTWVPCSSGVCQAECSRASSNGMTKLWIDDATSPISAQTLRMEHDDMRWLKAYQNPACNSASCVLTVHDQRCDIGRNTCPPNGPSVLDQSQRWDLIVFSRRPCGPMTLKPNANAS